MKAEIFEHYGHYFDLLYRDKDYQGEADYIQALLARFGIPEGSLLEFGAGTGRHGRLLARAGYQVLGVDCSKSMANRARSGGITHGFTYKVGDIRLVRFDRTFDAVIALFHVVSYQTTNDDLLSVFRNARAHLRPGGIFLFDVWYAPAVHAQKPSEREKHIEDKVLSVRRFAKPVWEVNENRVDVHYRIVVTDKATGGVREFVEIHKMRYFSLPELDLIADQTGFKRELGEEFLSGMTPSEQTWGVCVGLRAY